MIRKGYGGSADADLLLHYAWKGGKYLWKKIREGKMKNGSETNGGILASLDEPQPFGQMRTSGGKNISLKSVAISGTVEGLLFSSTITQEYKNETGEPLEIIYTFPVGYNTALLGMNATIGEKKLHGEVVAREEAEEQYEEAMEKGDSAIMVQESSLGLYTANLGNIRPDETVTVEIHCARFLSWEQGRVRLAIPTVIGERYGDPHASGALARHESAAADKNANYEFTLLLVLKGELANARVDCPTHPAQMVKTEEGLAISLGADAALDRDFVLLLEGVSGQSHALFAPDKEQWMAAASFCPAMPDVEENPLALKILVDCSGSMSGISIDQARQGIQKILNLLTPKDYASYSRFGSGVVHSRKSLLSCDPVNMKRLSSAIEATRANMGGTEMEKAVLSTVNDIANPGDAPAVLLLITDGDIWEVKKLIESARKTGHRIFVLGVGAAPAESVLMELAAQTGGICEFVTPNENMAQAMVRMFHRMRGKTARNIQVRWEQKPIWQSELPKYVYDGETVRVFALFAGEPATGPELSWQAGGEVFQAKVEGMEKTASQDLTRLGRSVQMREAEKKGEKLAIALEYQLVSSLTSLILVYERAENEKIKGLPKVQQVPQMPAYGHGLNLAASLMPRYSAFFCASNAFHQKFLPNRCAVFGEDGVSLPDDGDLKDQLEDMRSLWLESVMGLQSLAEFLNNNGSQWEKVRKILMDLASDAPLETLWAVLLEMLLTEANELDRHSLRLLKPHLPEKDKKEQLRKELGQSLPLA